LPADSLRACNVMRWGYEQNRVWFFSLLSVTVMMTYLQTYLLEGRVVFTVTTV